MEAGLKSTGHMPGLNQTLPVHAELNCHVSLVMEPCLTSLPFCKSIYRFALTWTSLIFVVRTQKGTTEEKLQLTDQTVW